MDIENNLHFYNGVCYEEYLYFSSVEYNSLFRIKKNDIVAEHIGVFLKEDYFQKNLHSQVIREGNKLYFIPYDGRGISVYDISERKFDFVPLTETSENISYVGAIQLMGKWMLIPSSDKEDFLYFDFKSCAVSICKSIKEKIENKLLGGYRIDIHGSICIANKLYIVFFNTSLILEINIENEDTKWHSVGTAQLANIEFDGKYFWVTTLKGDIYRWDCKTDDTEKYTVIESERREFMRSVSWNDKLYLIPNQCNSIWNYNYESNSWVSLESFLPQEFKRELTEFSLMMGHGVIDNQLVLYPRSGNGALIISDDNKMIYKKMITNCSITKKLASEKIEKLIIQENIVEEDSNMGLGDFIEFIGGSHCEGS